MDSGEGKGVFNDAVNCKDYIVVLGEWMSREHWWSDTNRGGWSIGGMILPGERSTGGMILTGEGGALVEC